MVDPTVCPPDPGTGSVRVVRGIVHLSGVLRKGPGDSQWAHGVSKQSAVVVLYRLAPEVI